MGLVCSVAEGHVDQAHLLADPISQLRSVSHRLLERCTIQPFGVLGISDLGPEPSGTPLSQGAPVNAVLVDGASLQDLLENTPFAAKGESLSLYTWLGISSRQGRFPVDVQQFFNKDRYPERTAKYHKYGEGQHVIHVATPHVRKLDQGIHELIMTYVGILWEFCEAMGPDFEEEDVSPRPPSSAASGSRGSPQRRPSERESSAPRHLRLLPIASDCGMTSKDLFPQLGRMFWTSLAIAMEHLPEVLQRRLQSAVIEVCIYRTVYVKIFEDALREKWYGGGLRSRDQGQLRICEGSYDWIRQRSQTRDRFTRLSAASMTMRAVWEQGYCLSNGRGVGLNHISRMLTGTRIRYADETVADRCLEKGGECSKPNVQGCIDDTATVVELATALARKGKIVSAINVSSPHCPGGDTLTGDCHGPEEEWCITTTLLKSLQHAHYLRMERQETSSSDSSRNSFVEDGCVVSPFVEVFRDTSEQGYVFMPEPAILSSVVTIMLDSRKTLQVSEDDICSVLHNAIAAVIESGAEVLVCPYVGIFELLENPVVAGSLLGKVLCQMKTGSLVEVVLVGSKVFAKAACCTVLGEALPEPTVAAEAGIFHNCSASSTIGEGGALHSSRSKGIRRRGWGKTPRHDSSEFVSKHYTEVREIGAGSFGRVALVRENVTQEDRVCKTVNIGGMKPEMVRMLKREAELLCSLDHPGVVRLYEYAEDLMLQEIIMVLEYVPGGGLDELLAQSMGVPISESLVVHIISQLLATLAYCHARDVIHRDLKPENIMLTCRPIWRNPDVKLIDFGAAAGQELKNEIIGTVEYMAPEIILGKKSGAKADVWAAAVIAFELLHGEAPFGACDDELSEAEKKIASDACEMVQKRIIDFSGNFEELESHSAAPLWHKWQCRNDRFWQRSSAESQDLLQDIFKPRPDDRPDAVQVLAHPWLHTHRPEPNKLTYEMALSFTNYVKAPKVVQCCMVIVAATFGIADMEDVSAAFLSADADCDGKLSVKELRHALAEIERPPSETATLSRSPECGQPQEGPVKDLLITGDLGITEGFGFTEFLAACLFSKQTSLERLIEDAFHALDADRDGVVLAQDARGIFETPNPELSLPMPQDHAIVLSEWCACVNACINGDTLEEALKSVGIPSAVAPPQPTPTLRVRRRGPRSGCC